MKKAGKILIGFLLVIGAMLIREAVTSGGMILTAIVKASGSTPMMFQTALSEIVGNTEMLLFFSALGTFVWIVVFGLIYRTNRRSEGKKIFSGPFKARRLFLLLVMGFGLQFFINSILGVIMKAAPQLLMNYLQVIELLGMGNSLISLVYIVLIAPIGEELVFRGVILNYMKKHVSFLTANIFQGVFFGIYHLNVVQGIYAFLLGMLLGWIAEKYGSIRESILLHMAVNLSGCLAGFLLPENIFDHYIGLLALFLVSALLLVFSVKNVKIEEVEKDEKEVLERI